MSVTVRQLLENKKKYFHLKLLAGQKGLDYVCSWVHLMEDCRIAEFFWGNEMVVTSGYMQQDEERFIQTLQTLIDKHCTAVVVNTGLYIHTLSQKVIDFCEENNLPLLTMPWEMSMTEFVRECCTQITRSVVNEEKLAEAVMHLVRFPDESSDMEDELQEYFDVDQGLVFFSVDIRHKEKEKKLEQRNQLRIYTAMREYSFPYLIFRQEHHLCVLVNVNQETAIREVAEKIYHTVHVRFPQSEIHIGIGEAVISFNRLNFAFESAQAARRQALLRQEKITHFSDIGFLKLFYTVSDESVLLNYYQEVMHPLLEYEKKTRKEGIYVETLFRYLLSDCSLQRVAKSMYIHENTIYYRMNRIREILNNSLGTLEQRQPFLMAYYCGLILKLVPEYS